ncbi:hypothetical protein [Pseudovibrio sp. Ad46]|uniref:hypothetical protein n=1 Tax=Pseudovibrio sp. Ad46 TaxID=989432 RepID=UPI0012903A45|nr:hypothetical protein [Pseudovibrio sp. Ad46]
MALAPLDACASYTWPARAYSGTAQCHTRPHKQGLIGVIPLISWVHEGPLSVASERFQTRGALLADTVYSRLLSSRDRFGLGSTASYRVP